MKIYLLLAVTLLSFASLAPAQRRDYMTDAEIELVRDNQDIDKRIEVLVRMIDRRLAVAGVAAVGAPARTKKDKSDWGPEPEGTRLQLLTDVKYLLQKAIDDIDDVSEHNADTKTQNKESGPLFPVAVRTLAAAAGNYLPALKTASEKAQDARERGILLQSIESCELILDAVRQLPPEVKKKEG